MKDKLLNVRSNGWKDLNEDELNEIYNFCDEYKKFLNMSKTERETIENCKNIAIENGFKNIMEIDTLKPNDKVYYINKYKNIFLAVIGKRCIDEGLNIIASHADSPRLDLKPNPLYEEEGLAYFKTHYYGGIKKYQWTTIPLSIHGVIVKSSGEKINIVIGEDDDDPIFTITDLLPHLAYNQMEKKMKDSISGENLNVLIGNIPYDKDSIKLNILDMLNKKYNITEIDFISSEIEIVPALKCRDLGLDKSMIAGYAQDDKASVYTSIKALIDLKDIEKTAICVVTDKEEIGSFGNTSLNSNAFDYFISLIKQKINNNISLDQIYINSNMISADVDVAMDPIYEYVFEKNNATFLGKGISISKYSSSSGKDNCSDANAEYVAYLRNIFEKNNIKYQAGEVGKVDSGDGGTFSYVFSNKGMESIDCGIAILSMHSPYEVSSKYDIYTSYRAYKCFYESY